MKDKEKELLSLIDDEQKPVTTINRLCHQHIGQVRVENAQQEIRRLNAQTSKKWKADFSDYLFCEDETDEHIHNPCRRDKGYCWIVTI